MGSKNVSRTGLKVNFFKWKILWLYASSDKRIMSLRNIFSVSLQCFEKLGWGDTYTYTAIGIGSRWAVLRDFVDIIFDIISPGPVWSPLYTIVKEVAFQCYG